MTDPEKSQYQAHPWRPTVNPSDDNQKDAGDKYEEIYGVDPHEEKPSGEDSKPPVSGNVPSLSMAYTQAPHLVPGDRGGGDGGSQDMQYGRFSVSLSSLRTAEQKCLDATGTAIHGYDELKAHVLRAAAADGLFGENVGKWVSGGRGKAANELGRDGPKWEPDKYNESAQQFADSVIPQMKNLLNSVAGAIEAMGAFDALLNNAGQLYATLDRNSAMTAGPGD
ncbi:hypothetical protein [Streptomyces coelicoflavus]|uniref:hypothetical protein n=1 Tax=Streptomyces coelicoflavus TaxID=285562 RepID=UPI002E275533